MPIIHLWDEKVDEAAFHSYLRRYRRWMSEEIQRLSGEGLKVSVEVVFTTHPLLDILKHVEEFKPVWLSGSEHDGAFDLTAPPVAVAGPGVYGTMARMTIIQKQRHPGCQGGASR